MPGSARSRSTSAQSGCAASRAYAASRSPAPRIVTPRPIAGASCARAVRMSGWSSTTSTFTRAPGARRTAKCRACGGTVDRCATLVKLANVPNRRRRASRAGASIAHLGLANASGSRRAGGRRPRRSARLCKPSEPRPPPAEHCHAMDGRHWVSTRRRPETTLFGRPTCSKAADQRTRPDGTRSSRHDPGCTAIPTRRAITESPRPRAPTTTAES